MCFPSRRFFLPPSLTLLSFDASMLTISLAYCTPSFLPSYAKVSSLRYSLCACVIFPAPANNDNSGLTCMFVRMLSPAIYGSVWDALEVRYGARCSTLAAAR